MFDQIAEQKIAEAIARGELDDLPGAGRPLELDDDAHVPEDLRVAYRILKNAGYVPPEAEALSEIGALEQFIARDDVDAGAKEKVLRKIALLRTAAEARLDRRRARISRRRG
ncbi:MAG TPA: DnaJ family domain-containing protein [Burkholderiales bacterium]|nr:DnaJ family domain-containing protein [Burkholderiales bacterium]